MAQKAIQKQFNEWVTQVYGGKGLTKELREELRKAFFSGAFVMMNMNRELGDLEKDIAVSKMNLYNGELLTEVTKWLAEGG